MGKNEKGLINMILIIQTSIVMFISIIIYINFYKYWSKFDINANGEFNVFIAIFFLIVTLITYWLDYLIITNVNNKQNSHIKWIIENIVFIILISLPVHIFSGCEDIYKYIFLLLILSSTIQYGSKYGIMTAGFSSISILVSDLLYMPTKDGVNMAFQNDIIITGIFMVIGWVLGYYVDLVKYENEKKENKLNVLNNKLEEKRRQRNEMKTMLLNNEACYDLLFENSINAVIVHKNGKILYANRSAANLLAYDYIDDLNEKVIYDFHDPKEIEEIKEKYIEIENQKGRKVVDEEEFIDSSGKIIPVSNTSTFFLYKEEGAVLSVLTDMTDEKKIESLQIDIKNNIKEIKEAKEFNMLITTFFVNMSHELKTPLNVIYSAVQAIASNCEINYIKKNAVYLKNMKQNCLRMTRLINNYVDATRIESGEMKLNRSNGDFIGVVENLVQKVAEYVKEKKNIDITFDTELEEKTMAFDIELIKRVVLNLISNSIKYGYEKISIFVNIFSEDKYIILKVRDNGKGIKKSKLKIIFECFGRGDKSLSRESEGAGIGLYLVKLFVELHNGQIELESSEGCGTEVTIKLPMEEIYDEGVCSNNMIFETDEEKIEMEFSDIYTL